MPPVSLYHRALILQGVSKCQEEEEVKPELVWAMEYTGVIGVKLIEYIDTLDCRMVTAAEGLDLSVVDLESRMQEVEIHQGNYEGLHNTVVKVWGKVVNVSDAVDNMEVDLDGLKEWVKNVGLVYMEVDQRVEQLEWELANTQWDMAMLVAEWDANQEQWV